MSRAELIPAPLELEKLSLQELDPEVVVAGEIGMAPLDLDAVGRAELGGVGQGNRLFPGIICVLSGRHSKTKGRQHGRET